MSIWKAHHGIMKQDALYDYEIIRALCLQSEKKIYEPKGKSWQKIEDATALMLSQFESVDIKLMRGASYYKSLIKK